MRLTCFVALLGGSATLALGGSVAGCNEPELGLPDPVDSGAGDTEVVEDAGADVATNVLQTGQIDRAGRPLMSLVVITDPAARDAYNRLDSFEAPLDDELAVAMQAGLVRADLLDGLNDWASSEIPYDGGKLPEVYDLPDGGFLSHPLARVLVPDALLVDPTMPFSKTSYWDIENEVLGGPAHTTCGGRTLHEDSVDKMLSILVKKSMSGVSDGVPAPPAGLLNAFPYLAPPHE